LTPGAVSGRHAKKILPHFSQTKRFWSPRIPPSTDIPASPFDGTDVIMIDSSIH